MLRNTVYITCNNISKLQHICMLHGLFRCDLRLVGKMTSILGTLATSDRNCLPHHKVTRPLITTHEIDP
jgi:hypothetical protein